MHDPMTVAHEIYLGAKKKKNGHYRSPLITIWHVDPEKDGTDDSCGWFIRGRHVDPHLLDKVTKEYEFNFKRHYWFNEAGYPKFSTIGVVVEMYSKAAWYIFMYYAGNNPTDGAHAKYRRFMRKYLFDIIHFAENPTDSLYTSVHMTYGVENAEERYKNFARLITADILRKLQPWYKHPRWHIHHWKIQFHPWEQFKRRYWDKCCVCGKRGFKSSDGGAHGDWSGNRLWHGRCDGRMIYPTPVDQNLRDTI